MKFSELVRLLEKNGFRLRKEKRSIRYYQKPGHDKLIRVDYHGGKEVPTGTCQVILKAAVIRGKYWMRRLNYSLHIEATEDPNFFSFYSADLEGFTGSGSSIEECVNKAQTAMLEHVELLEREGLPVPATNPDATVTLRNVKRVIPAA